MVPYTKLFQRVCCLLLEGHKMAYSCMNSVTAEPPRGTGEGISRWQASATLETLMIGIKIIITVAIISQAR